jgi:PAS domain S-box-containing protein
VVDYAIYMLSPEGEITNWNAGAERIKGYGAHEVVGTHFSRFYPADDRAAGLPMANLALARKEGRFEAEGWRLRKDGTRFRANVVIDPIHNDAGQLIGFAKITRDITQRAQLDEANAALAHARKLEAIGKLTGGVAHDFNNILQIIGGSLQLLDALVRNNPGAQRYVDMSLGAVDRGSKLSSQLLAFARRQPLQPMVMNIARVLRGMDELLRRALGELVDVEMVVGAGVWNTQVDPHQLENVLLNLAINARDAMPGGGQLTIELSNAMLDDTYVLGAPDMVAGQYVLLAVSDSGAGMAQDVLERAVEPFFTTKPDGQGTGLGLSMAFGFVKQSGGHFRIYSEPGCGTTVKMYFPRSHAVEEPESAPAAAPAAGGTETILVVEDDAAVQATVVEMLASLGYRVLKADHAEQALGVLRAGVACDLLFTDVVMPGPVKSTELARQARQLQPGIEVLFTSGYTQNAIIHSGRLDAGVQLLSKPYRREELARKVASLLHGPRQARAAAAPVRGRRVLVVEDNPDTLDTTCALVDLFGHAVRGVLSAEDALPLLAPGAFDVLVTDLRLPGMGGLALARAARAALPDLRVIFASGAAGLGEAEMAQLQARFLSKPFDAEALRQLLA